MPPTPIQNRKYLCQAPRNEVWDELRDGVIEKLGDNPAAVLTRTISQICDLHPELKRPRTGPGRKSNAEHALFFYQYLLDHVQNDEDEEEPMEDEDEDTQLLSHAAPQDPTTCNVCNEDRPDEKLIPCLTCPRAFHMSSCLHPKHADGESYDNWICPYCVLADPRTLKSQRHPAAAAVRVMARWRKQLERKRKQEAADLANETSIAKEEEEVDSAAAIGSEVPVEPTIQNPAVTEVASAVETETSVSSPQPPSTNHDAGPSSPDRSRRTRKQPSLYDPQSCAASRWTTDAPPVEGKPRRDDASDSDEDPSSEPPAAAANYVETETTNNSRLRQSVIDSGEGYWCNFCHDDPDVILCVFCACRVCFSKKNNNDQLVCQDCGQQYHAHCIGLPQPKKQGLSTTWTCSDCIEASQPKPRVVQARRPREAPATSTSCRRSQRAPAPRRPDASASSIPSAPPPTKRTAGRRPLQKNPTGRPTGGKRGRPPSQGPPRKRGRPPKKARAVDADSSMEVEYIGEADDSALLLADGQSSKPNVTTVITHTTRTGRAVKRSTFHDEIEEGAQLLKSHRKSSPRALVDDTPDAAALPEDTTTTTTIPEPMAPPLVEPPVAAVVPEPPPAKKHSEPRGPRRKPGARECMQISRRFGDKVIPEKYFDILMDYCNRGKVEHLIKMRERLDEHSRFLELQLAGLECLVQEKGESDVVVPLVTTAPEQKPPAES